MMHDLFLVPDVPDEAELQEGTEGLAWDHATLYCSLSDIEIGSDEFIEIHKEMLERYRLLGEHLGFVQHTAMRLIQALLSSKKAALVISKDETIDDVTENLVYLGHIATSCMMWLHAAYPTQWIENRVWEHLNEDYRGVDFPITLPSGGEKDDDHG